jgi:rhodanese-related sulfurtransferase
MRALPQPGRLVWRTQQGIMEQLLEFTGNNTVLVALLLISFFVLIFSELRRKASGMVAVDATAAVALINNDGIVVDLRGKDSFERGHIVNAKHIPFDELEAGKAKIEKFKNKPLVAVCDAGNMSTRAVAALREAGFVSAYTLKGGMNSWTQAGLPVVTSKKTRSGKAGGKNKDSKKQ